MSGRVCLVTGANSGIGRETALGLAHAGATVLMVCRDQGRGQAARSGIVDQTGNERVELFVADLASQTAIHRLTDAVTRKHPHLHVLVNSAGVAMSTRQLSADGVEMTFAINHLAPFLLTARLLDNLRSGAPSRIINVSSGMHFCGRMNFDDLQGQRRYNSLGIYSQSKLANVIFTYELARRLEGTGVTANCLDPGSVRTNFGTAAGGLFGLLSVVAGPWMASAAEAAQTPLYLAISPEVEGVTGGYWARQKRRDSSARSLDVAIAKQLWQLSETMIATTTARRARGT
jgi:NAD(P)-dependent dehydrogenase (short-subunit alcohol dehydrogenase family)